MSICSLCVCVIGASYCIVLYNTVESPYSDLQGTYKIRPSYPDDENITYIRYKTNQIHG